MSGEGFGKYSDDQFIAAVRKHEPASTKEVADTVGCSRPTAETHLKQLAAADRIHEKLVGRSLVWFMPED